MKTMQPCVSQDIYSQLIEKPQIKDSALECRSMTGQGGYIGGFGFGIGWTVCLFILLKKKFSQHIHKPKVSLTLTENAVKCFFHFRVQETYGNIPGGFPVSSSRPACAVSLNGSSMQD